jgi:biotin carboxylase
VAVVTGAAGSIVSAIVADLCASAPGATFYLLDLAPEPAAGDPDVARFRADREGLKTELARRMQQRGERATPVAVERQLAAIERAAAASAAIEAIRRAGGSAEYRSLDLRDAAAVTAVIGEIRARHSRIDVLVHAAGLEISHALADKPPEELDRVFDVKADGWHHLMHAIGDLPLGAAVAFGSVAGRFGNAGQTDYAAANDLLCKLAAHGRRARPATRWLVIDWSAWGGIGMATRGSIPRLMAAAGIDLLPPGPAVRVVGRELAAGTAGELVVAGGLGALERDRDDSGGLDVSRVVARGPLVGQITGMSLARGLTVETTLDPGAEPFLRDHRIDGKAVLPGVMGIEAFAEIATLLLPGWRLAAVEDVAFLAPFKFYKGAPRTLTIEAQLETEGDEIVAACRLSGSRSLAGVRRASGQHQLHRPGAPLAACSSAARRRAAGRLAPGGRPRRRVPGLLPWTVLPRPRARGAQRHRHPRPPRRAAAAGPPRRRRHHRRAAPRRAHLPDRGHLGDRRPRQARPAAAHRSTGAARHAAARGAAHRGGRPAIRRRLRRARRRRGRPSLRGPRGLPHHAARRGRSGAACAAARGGRMTRFERIAIVNRGEAAMRLIVAARELSQGGGRPLTTIALYSQPDRGALFVREADERHAIGPPTAYLDLDRLASALRAVRADAAWVGWGFVAENPAFAELCARLGVTFIGPDAAVMRRLGDKIAAKRAAEAAGVPVAPWSGGPIASLDEALAAGRRIGYPLMVKASAGGGGRGIRRVVAEGELSAALELARAEAQRSFGDPTVFLEAALDGARHVEVQIIGDHHGTVWALGTRDCTAQRRHQKLIEEAPAPLSPAEDRAVRDAAVRLAARRRLPQRRHDRAAPRSGRAPLSFMEVNARLQVEHPVTEVTTGVDLVKLQLHVAAGGKLEGEPPATTGHAIELRLNARRPRPWLRAVARDAGALPHAGGAPASASTPATTGATWCPSSSTRCSPRSSSPGATAPRRWPRARRALSRHRRGPARRRHQQGLPARFSSDDPRSSAASSTSARVDRLVAAGEHRSSRGAEVAVIAAAARGLTRRPPTSTSSPSPARRPAAAPTSRRPTACPSS